MDDLQYLWTLLSGEFSNQPQAIAEPVHFVQLRLWQRALLLFGHDRPCLFLEQANALQLDRPYRQRLLCLEADFSGQLSAQFYQFKNAAAVLGAGQDPDRLRSLTPEDVQLLESCRLAVEQTSRGGYNAQLPAGCRCRFWTDGIERQVSLGFEVWSESDRVNFHSFDRGIDPETGRSLWGALMGPYEFTKVADYAVTG